MTDSNCIFCKIAKGEITSNTIYEDNNFRAILDISPAAKGHVLILPKNHAANIYELSEEDASKVFVIACKIAKILKDSLNCEGMNILQNNGEIAGQTVLHFHLHLIPRYKEDNIEIKWEHKEFSAKELEDLALLIKEKL